MSELTRSKTYTDVVTTVIGASAINKSEVMKDFESYAFGGAKVQVVASDLSEVTGTIDVNTYVSFDEGENYVIADTDNTLAAGTGAASVVNTILVAPRVKVQVESGAGEAITADAGAAVHVQLEEADVVQGERKMSKTDNVVLSASVHTAYSDVLSLDSIPTAVYFGAIVLDATEITVAGTAESVVATLESSLDGINFWEVDSTGVTVIGAATKPVYAFSSLSASSKNFGTYFRLKLADSSTAARATADAGLSLIMISAK